jgi:hypothetical protein
MSSLASRGATTFDFFQRGSRPVEADPGESQGLERRMGGSDVFPSAE